MPLSNPKNIYADGPGGTNLVTVAETVIATLAGVDTTPEGDQVILEGFAQITTGASTTGLQLRVRRTNLAGAQVGATAQVAAGAAAAQALAIQVADVPGEQAGGQYVLTAQQIAATGNGTAVAASLQATY